MSSFFFLLLHPFVMSLAAVCAAEISWRSKTSVMRSVKSSRVQRLSDGGWGGNVPRCLHWGSEKGTERRLPRPAAQASVLFCFPSLIPPWVRVLPQVLLQAGRPDGERGDTSSKDLSLPPWPHNHLQNRHSGLWTFPVILPIATRGR